jgi:hypothetical protein
VVDESANGYWIYGASWNYFCIPRGTAYVTAPVGYGMNFWLTRDGDDPVTSSGEIWHGVEGYSGRAPAAWTLFGVFPVPPQQNWQTVTFEIGENHWSENLQVRHADGTLGPLYIDYNNIQSFDGIDCRDPRYRRFWERMAEAGVPLLAHTGGEHTVPQVDARQADPRTLALPLECGVTVIAAHAATQSGFFDPDYLEALAAMMERHPRLYADNSAFNIPIRSRAYRRCLEPPLCDRLLHGSDFPVPILGYWAWLRGLIERPTLRRCQAEPNLLERDLQLKRAIGFSEAAFTRAWSLLRVAPPPPRSRQHAGDIVAR